MKTLTRMFPAFPMAIAAVTLGAAAPAGWADGNETPFAKADLFFELNNTDGDLGIHADIDGVAWKNLTIETPNEGEVLQILVKGNLRRQGLTQLGFESAEPPFDELPPAQFFRRFPEGVYEIEGTTLDGAELESTVEITHVMPAPPNFRYPALASCDEPVVVTGPVTIDWDPVTESHPDVGTPGVDIEVARYEVAVERKDLGLELFVQLPLNVTSFVVPKTFTEVPGVVKFEVLVKAAGGNRTAEESCFEIE